MEGGASWESATGEGIISSRWYNIEIQAVTACLDNLDASKQFRSQIWKVTQKTCLWTF